VFSDFGRDHGIKIHFIDEKGTRHELHRQPQAIISPSNDSIEPGKTLCFSIDLTQNDAGILETRQITYKFLIYDPTTYERVWVESKPLSLSGGCGSLELMGEAKRGGIKDDFSLFPRIWIQGKAKPANLCAR
jgi:hypothetical protein